MRLPFQRQNPAGLNQHLNMRLPPSPDPACIGCGAKLRDVRHFHIELLTGQIYDVHVLAQCQKCLTNHIGKRSIGSEKGKTRFLAQKFERYSEAEHGEFLRTVTQRINKKRDKFERIQAKPVLAHPDEAASLPAQEA